MADTDLDRAREMAKSILAKAVGNEQFQENLFASPEKVLREAGFPEPMIDLASKDVANFAFGRDDCPRTSCVIGPIEHTSCMCD